MNRRHVLVTALLAAAPSLAMQPMPEEPGWNGFVNPKVTAMDFRDNQISGTGPLDVGNKRIDSLDDKPESESAGTFSLSGEVGYLFEEPSLYLFLGNRLEDVLNLDNSTALGVRKDLGDTGILEGSLLFSSVPVEVWEDPFLTGADRKETDRTSTGARFGVGNILGSKFEVQATFRSVEIDDERSGESLMLTDPERAMLDRNGDLARIEVLYTWVINENHVITPSIDLSSYDADGDAISRDGAGVQVSHVYRADRLRLVSNVLLRQYAYDEENPVFDDKQDENEIVLSLTAIYAQFLDVQDLSFMASLLYAEGDSDINFYDSEAEMASVGVLYQF